MEATGSSTVLDVGCGPVTDGRAKYQPGDPPTYLGIDAVAPCDKRGFMRGRLPEAMSWVWWQAFDLVMALDFIEHLERAAGERLIREMKRTAKRAVLIFTPNGFRDNSHNAKGDPLLEHRDGWTAAELEAHGFEVEVWDFWGEKEAALWAVWRNS